MIISYTLGQYTTQNVQSNIQVTDLGFYPQGTGGTTITINRLATGRRGVKLSGMFRPARRKDGAII